MMLVIRFGNGEYFFRYISFEEVSSLHYFKIKNIFIHSIGLVINIIVYFVKNIYFM